MSLLISMAAFALAASISPGPVNVLATAVGGKLAKRISQERFLKLTYVLLLVIGTVLLVTS